MKRFLGKISLLLAAIAILGAAATAAAQDKLKVTIPFAFTADHQHLPAGAYNVDWLSDRFMELRNAKTGEARFLMVRPEEGQVIETRGRFVFLQDGSRYYLARVWMAGTSVHSEMIEQHRPERTAQVAKAPEPSTVEVTVN